MAQEEIDLTSATNTNKFKAARNEFRKTRKQKEEEEMELENDEMLIEDVMEEEKPKVKNRIKQEQPANNETAAENEEGVQPKRKKRVPKEKINPFQPIINFIKDERLHKVAGLTLILASIILLVAFTSFLFTWKADQDKVSGSWWELFFGSDDALVSATPVVVDNWLGKVGAVVAHVFIHKGFGIVSYFFVAFSLIPIQWDLLQAH